MITFSQIKNDSAIKTYIEKADEMLIAMGYTEHSFAHVTKVAETAKYILLTTGHTEREAELAQIASYLHDIGNLINREEHAQSGALMAFQILNRMGADPDDIATIVTAVGNHDESTSFASNAITAALILADKTDVRNSRVRNKDVLVFDIHDRVNYSVTHSHLAISDDLKEITLTLDIDTAYCPVMDYFEIFLTRMLLCRKSAEVLGLVFRLIINSQQIM